MELFRLHLTMIDGEDYSNIVVEFPDEKTCKLYVENPGDEGYHFYNIISTMFSGLDKLDYSNNVYLSEKDSILRWNLIKRE